MDTINYYPSDTTISGLLFSNYTSEEIRRLSVKELTSSLAIDRLGAPVSGGPYDLALGPFDKNDRCFTCGQGFVACPGHIGHISLVLPLYNPVFFRNLVTVSEHSFIRFNQLEFRSDYLGFTWLLSSLSYYSMFQCRKIPIQYANVIFKTWPNQ